MIRKVLQMIGLLPRPWCIAGRPDRCNVIHSVKVKPSRGIESVTTEPVSWGKNFRSVVVASHPGGYTWSIPEHRLAEKLKPGFPYTKIDDQFFERYHLRTKSFTLEQYGLLRTIYLAKGQLTTREVMEHTGKSRSWVEKRWPAVKGAMEEIMAMQDQGRPIPYREE